MLQSYLDGECSLGEPEWVADHLTGCAACRVELDDLKRASILLRKLPALPINRSFAKQVLQRAQEAQRAQHELDSSPSVAAPARSSSRGPQLALLAASLSAVALLGWWLARNPGATPQPRLAQGANLALETAYLKQRIQHRIATQLSDKNPDLEQLMRWNLVDMALRTGGPVAARRDVKTLAQEAGLRFAQLQLRPRQTDQPRSARLWRRVLRDLDPAAHAAEPLTASRIFQQALAAVDRGELLRAAGLFEKAREQANKQLRGQILLYEMRCRMRLRTKQQFKRVATLKNKLLDDYPALADEARLLQRRSDNIERLMPLIDALSKSASGPSANERVADMLMGIQDPARAIAHYAKALDGSNSRAQSRVRFALAWCHKSAGQYTDAIKLYTELAETGHPSYRRTARAEAGNAAMLAGQHDRAFEHYRALVASARPGPAQELARCHLALAYLYSNNPHSTGELKLLSRGKTALAGLARRILEKNNP